MSERISSLVHNKGRSLKLNVVRYCKFHFATIDLVLVKKYQINFVRPLALILSGRVDFCWLLFFQSSDQDIFNLFCNN